MPPTSISHPPNLFQKLHPCILILSETFHAYFAFMNSGQQNNYDFFAKTCIGFLIYILKKENFLSILHNNLVAIHLN